MVCTIRLCHLRLFRCRSCPDNNASSKFDELSEEKTKATCYRVDKDRITWFDVIRLFYKGDRCYTLKVGVITL